MILVGRILTAVLYCTIAQQVGWKTLDKAEIEKEQVQLSAYEIAVDYDNHFTLHEIDLGKLESAAEDLTSLRERDVPDAAAIYRAFACARALLAKLDAGEIQREALLRQWRVTLRITSTSSVSTEKSDTLQILDWRGGGLAFRPSVNQLSLETSRTLPTTRDIPFLLRPLPIRPEMQRALESYTWAGVPEGAGNEFSWSQVMIREPATGAPVVTYGKSHESGMAQWGVSFDGSGKIAEMTEYVFSAIGHGLVALEASTSISYRGGGAIAIYSSKLANRKLRSVDSPVKLDVPAGAHLYDLTSGTGNPRWCGVDPKTWPDLVRRYLVDGHLRLETATVPVPQNNTLQRDMWSSTLFFASLVVLGVVVIAIARVKNRANQR